METQDAIVAFKGFDANLRCRGFQYEIGASYVHEGPVVRCTAAGFHACENPLDVFSYYSPHGSRYCSVEVSGEISRDGSDSKIAAAKLTVVAEIGIPGIVTSFVKWVMERIDASLSHTNTGNMSASTNTGDMSASTNTGYRSASTNTGNMSASTNTGYMSASTNTGNMSASTNTGNMSASTNTGNRSASTNTGYMSASTNTGDMSASIVSGKESVAIATGCESKAKAGEGSAIVIVSRADDGSLLHIFASKVGENGIKADTFYMLDKFGVPQEVGNG